MSALIETVLCHGSVLYPPTRNAIDSTLPPWKGATIGPNNDRQFPQTGHWKYMPFGCDCSNGTSLCESGQGCFWFSQGCTIGCEECDGNGERVPGGRNVCNTTMQPTNNDPNHRTSNRHVAPGSAADTTKFMPWRAPGNAPVSDPCGLAGGTWWAQTLGGDFNTTQYATLGDKGSAVLPYRPTGIQWQRGGVGKPTWYVRANHGGGYSYRLCKYQPGVNVTEACFQQIPLDFAPTSRIVWRNGSSAQFTPTLLSEGTTPKGSMWAMNPLPVLSRDYPAPCEHVGGPVRAPTAYLQWGENPNDCSGTWPTTLYIEDTIKIPQHIEPGEYVLGWRWDCEETTQIWQSCSDISIV